MEIEVCAARRWVVDQDGWLQVSQGRVWLTRDHDAADHVLAAGQSLWLWRGDRLTLEPWVAGEPARLQARPVGEPAPMHADQAGDLRWRDLGLRGAALAARGLAGGLLALARSAEAMASRAQGSICAGESMASSGALK